MRPLFQNGGTCGSLSEIRTRVDTLDSAYSTQLRGRQARIAKFIFANARRLGSLIANGDEQAVAQIRYVPGVADAASGNRGTYSFATKFCGWSNRRRFAIFDSVVEFALPYVASRLHPERIAEVRAWAQKLDDYPLFRTRIAELRDEALPGADFKTFDGALWILGFELREPFNAAIELRKPELYGIRIPAWLKPLRSVPLRFGT
ncbi:MAG: hypothetical protein WAN74_02205 [Thermoplasmata archaeon]